MFGRVITIVILAGAAYWYWSGPFQAQHNPNAAQSLQQDIENMRKCVRGQNYKAGATGIGEGDPETICADRFGLYYYEGEWRKKGQ